MANGNVTITTMDKWIDEHWDPELNRAVMLDMTIAKLFTDKSSLLPSGDTIHRPASHHLTANDKSASTDATPETLTETEQTFVVSTHKIVSQEIESIADVQSKYDIRAEFNHNAGYALSRAYESSCAALLDDNTTQTVGVLGSELTVDNLLGVRAYLRNVGAAGPFVGVIAPATYNGFLKIEQFTRADAYGAGADAITRANVGKLFDMEFYESQLTTGTSPQSYGCVWVKGHFFKVIQKAPKLDVWFSPLAKAWVVAVDTIYGMFENQEADEAAAVTTVARLYSVRLESKK